MKSPYRRLPEDWKVLWEKRRLEKALSPEDKEILKMQQHEARKEHRREYMRSRRDFRKNNPAFMEIDRLSRNTAMRKYLAKRRKADPAFAEACRLANREAAGRRRVVKKFAKSVEIDET